MASKGKNENSNSKKKNTVRRSKKEVEIVKNNNSKLKKEEVMKKDNNFLKMLFFKKYSLFDLLVFVIIFIVLSSLLTSQYVVHRYKGKGVLCNATLSRDKYLSEFTSVYQEVGDNYYEDVDKKKMIEAAIDGMLNFLEDNYSIHMNNDQSDSFDDNLDGTYEGIGIVLQGIEIIEVYKNSPAEKAGLKIGDVVKKINGEEMSLENAYDVIQNVKDNTEGVMNITVERDGKIIDKEIAINRINLPIVTSNFVDINNNRIGYIKITSFTENSFEQFNEQLVELEQKNNIQKLIIDLRDNGGGYLEQSADIASLFIEKGKIIYSLEDKKKKNDVKDDTKEKRDYKIVLLVNGASASASEILTAALKDNNNAIIVGTKTFGKGKVQTTKKLDDGTILKYTSSKWLRPNGDCIDGNGIIPDYEVEQSDNKDNQYEKAISLLK